MRQKLTVILLLIICSAIGQTGNGLYRGQKLFEICYVNVTDTTAEIEYFYQKGRQIFAHRPAEKLVLTKTGFRTQDDSIKVIRADKFLVVKTKRHAGKLKLYPSTHQFSDINELRIRNKERRHYQDSLRTGQQETGGGSR
jgi:hypothetical protein